MLSGLVGNQIMKNPPGYLFKELEDLHFEKGWLKIIVEEKRGCSVHPNRLANNRTKKANVRSSVQDPTCTMYSESYLVLWLAFDR